VPGEAAVASDSWFFGCTACGKCCNSPPRLRVPELFHHQARFIGCLGLQRRGFDVEFFVHAFAFGSQKACPALRADGGCAIHDDRKPSGCGLVPLDGSLSDSAQSGVLALRRREARFWGADCIREQPAPGFRELTRQLRVVDPEAQASLARYRREQADEDLYWIRAVTRAFGPELLDHPARVREIPEDGMLTVSLVPVLSVLAETSRSCRERIRGFVLTQNDLMRELIAGAIARRNAADRADTALLRRLLGTSQAFAAQLERMPPPEPSRLPEHVNALEAWLGV
jgi:hypothetical protein